MPGYTKVSQTLAGIGEDAIYAAPGVYHLLTQNPVTSLKGIGTGMVQPFVHPIRTWQQRPQDFLYAGLTFGTGVAAGAARGSAARAALRATAGKRIPTTVSRAGIVTRAALKRPDYGSRTIVLRDPKTGKVQRTVALNFDTPLGQLIAKGTDRALGLSGKAPRPRRPDRGVRQFLVRGVAKVRAVALWYALAHNLLRAFELRAAGAAA